MKIYTYVMVLAALAMGSLTAATFKVVNTSQYPIQLSVYWNGSFKVSELLQPQGSKNCNSWFANVDRIEWSQQNGPFTGKHFFVDLQGKNTKLQVNKYFKIQDAGGYQTNLFNTGFMINSAYVKP